VLLLIRIGPGPGLDPRPPDDGDDDDDEDDGGRGTDPDDPAGPTDPSPDPGDDDPTGPGGGPPEDDDPVDRDPGGGPDPDPLPEPEPEPEPDPDAFTDLFVDLGDRTIRADEETSVSVEARTVAGDFVPVPNPLSLESGDPDVAVVSGGDTAVGVGPGETEIVAQASGVDGLVSADVDLSVDPAPVDVDQPLQPSDPAEVILPFGAFNGIPGVSGARNVRLTVPQLPDITGAVTDALPTFGQLNRVVSREVGAIDIPQPPTPTDIADAVLDTLDAAGVPSLTEVTATIDAELRTLDIPDPADIVDPIEEAVGDVQRDLRGAIDGLLTDIDQSIASVDRFVQDGIDGLQATVDGVAADLEALSGAVDEGFTELEAAVDELPDSVPALDDIASEVTDSVVTEIEDELVPTVEGVSLLDDPVAFFEVAVEGVLEDLLSNDTQRDILRASRRRR
jgi:hypothetical protein